VPAFLLLSLLPQCLRHPRKQLSHFQLPVACWGSHVSITQRHYLISNGLKVFLCSAQCNHLCTTLGQGLHNTSANTWMLQQQLHLHHVPLMGKLTFPCSSHQDPFPTEVVHCACGRGWSLNFEPCGRALNLEP
jgi:hypothetical protein